MYQEFSFWDLAATNTLQKSCLFSTLFTFLQKCKRTGRNFDIWTIQKYQNLEMEFYVIFFSRCKHFRSRLRVNLRWGTFLITIKQVTYFEIYIYAYQVTEFLMGFPTIPKLCSGVIPFRSFKRIKTTYRCD